MLHSAGDAADLLKHGQSFLGPGWREAQSFDDVSDPEDYSDTEEEEYVVLDLGSTADTRSLQAESSYQLIGMDTPMPFLKIGNQVYQGQVTPLIGDEVILELKREYDRPAAKPSHPPFAVSAQRLTFRAVKLEPRVSRTEDIDGTPAADEAKPAATPVQYTPEGRIRRVTVDKKNHMATRPIFVQPRGGVQPSASASVSRHGTPGGATPTPGGSTSAPDVSAAPAAETQSAVVGQGGDTGQTAPTGAQPEVQGAAGDGVVQYGDAPRLTVPPDQPALEAEDWFDSAVANIDPSLRAPVEGSRNTSMAPEATPQPPTVQNTLESLPAPPVQPLQPAAAVVSEGSAAATTSPDYIPFISSSSYRPLPPNVAATTVPRKVGRPRKEQIQIFDVAELMDIDVSQLNAKSRIELLPRPKQIDETHPGPSDMPGALGPLQVFTKAQVIKFQAGMPLSGKGSRGRRSSGLGGRGAGPSRSTPVEGILGPGEEHEDGSESGAGAGQAAAGSAASDLPDIPGLPPGLVVDRRIALRLAKAEKRRQAILEEQNKDSLGSREFVTAGGEEVEEALARQAEAEAAASSVIASTAADSAAGGEDTSTT